MNKRRGGKHHFNIYFMKWTNEEINLLKDNYSNGTEFLSKILNRSKDSIIHKANRIGLYISKEYKFKISKINGHKRRGYKKENYSVSDITNNINEYSAYILGLLWTDGYILKNRNTIGLTMVKDDLSKIDWIFNKTGNWYMNDRKRIGKRESRTLTAYNPIFVDKLVSLDYDKKSFVSPYKVSEIIPSLYFKYFIRGIIDGDGCFYINHKNYTYQLTISSTYEQDWSFYIDFFNKNGFEFFIQRRISGENKSSIIRLCKRDKIFEFSKWLYDGYENDKIGLKRKYDKSILFIK